MEFIMQSTSDLEIFYLKRLLRNIKYLFPAEIEEIDPHSIRESLLTSKTNTNGVNATKGIIIEEQSKFDTFIPEDINAKIEEVNKQNNQLRESEEGSNKDEILVVEDENGKEGEKAKEEQEGLILG